MLCATESKNTNLFNAAIGHQNFAAAVKIVEPMGKTFLVLNMVYMQVHAHDSGESWNRFLFLPFFWFNSFFCVFSTRTPANKNRKHWPNQPDCLYTKLLTGTPFRSFFFLPAMVYHNPRANLWRSTFLERISRILRVSRKRDLRKEDFLQWDENQLFWIFKLQANESASIWATERFNALRGCNCQEEPFGRTKLFIFVCFIFFFFFFF